MRKLFQTITLLISALFLSIGFAVPAFAGSISISPDRATVGQGEEFCVYVTVYGNDIYNAYIDVTCDDIFSGGMTDILMSDGGSSISAEVTIQAVGTGTGSIYVRGYTDEEEEIWLTGSCTVTVTAGSGGGGGGSGRDAGAGTDYGYGDGTYINNNPTGEGSGNAAASYIRLFGPDKKELDLHDDGNGIFSASVLSSVDKITIDVGAEDEKATVSGAGEKELRVGSNTFDVVITAENGLQVGYQIHITRKDERVALSDLEAELKESKAESLTVMLKDGDILDAALLKSIRAWGKTLYLNRYDEDGAVLYGWTIRGANIAEDMTSFDPAVTFDSGSKEKIEELSNFASGKILNLAHSGKLPEGTLLTLRNQEEFKEGAALHLYHYNTAKESLQLEEQKIRATKEAVVLRLDHASEYFLTRSVIPQAAEEAVLYGKSEKNPLLWPAIAGAAVIVFLAAALCFVLIRNKKQGLRIKKSPEAEMEAAIRITGEAGAEVKDE